MAMKVYKSGSNVLIEKDANPVIRIPVAFSSVRIVNETVTVFSILDATVSEFDTVANIQDSGGTPIGNLTDVVKYLNSFIFSGSTTTEAETTPSGGEANTGSNVGTGDGVFKQKTGVDLEFKTLIGGTNVNLTNNPNDLTIDVPSVGEDNTSSNVGTGDGVFKQKTGVDFEFKTLIGGTNVTITNNANDLTIDATGGASTEQFYLERVETIDNGTAVPIEYFTEVQGGTEISNVINVTGGTYWFEWSFICFNTSKSGRVVVDLQVNSVNVFSQSFRREPKDTDEFFYQSISKRVDLSSGNNTIQIQLSNDTSGTGRIYEANVQITKV